MMHAYLIMAHNNFSVLEKLIGILDNACSDIYIHIDKRVKNFDFAKYKSIAKKSKVYFTDRIHISWGDYSMVKAEYILLKKAFASGRGYKYYHLLSGVDMPIKTAKEITDFFDNAYPKEFVHYEKTINEIEMSRIKHYHFFSGRRNLFNRIMTKSEQIIQTALKIDRMKNLKIARGSQWFSITDKLAEYLLKNEESISRRLKHSFIPDEFFVQLAVINTDFKNRVYSDDAGDICKQTMRYIDWKRGNPYTFSEEDFEEIMDSGGLFVRKLTETNNLPKMICERVKNKE